MISSVKTVCALLSLAALLSAIPAFAEPAEPAPAEPAPTEGAASPEPAAPEGARPEEAAVAPALPVESAAPRRAPRAHSSCAILSSCGYHRVLDYLVITRDVALPGAPSVALRLLPTAHALAGESSTPVVVRPTITSAGYGFDIAARF